MTGDWPDDCPDRAKTQTGLTVHRVLMSLYFKHNIDCTKKKSVDFILAFCSSEYISFIITLYDLYGYKYDFFLNKT